MRPHRRQPIRLCHLLDSPGKITGVGCHFLQCMKVKSESEVAQSCPTLCDPMDCSLPGSSVHGIFQARVLEWVAIAFSEIHRHGPANPSTERQERRRHTSVSTVPYASHQPVDTPVTWLMETPNPAPQVGPHVCGDLLHSVAALALASGNPGHRFPQAGFSRSCQWTGGISSYIRQLSDPTHSPSASMT